MKREIQFKGKTLFTNKWQYGNLFFDLSNRAFIGRDISIIGYRFYEIKPETACQLTGVVDLKLQAIFEHDIVECGYGVGKVVFKAGCFMVEWLDDKEAYMEYLHTRKNGHTREQDERFTVIGNIFDNQKIVRQFK